MTVTDFFQAIRTAPADTDGVATGDSTWRLCVQLLVASHGARVGLSKVGTARVSEYAWYDLTPYLVGIETKRGKPATSPGFPRAEVGTAMVTLNNASGLFSAWRDQLTVKQGNKIDTAIFNRELKPRSLIRVAMFKPGCSISSSTDGNGITSTTRTNYVPIFTGFVEGSSEDIRIGSNLITFTLVETLTFLATINDPAQASAGAGDSVVARLNRLCPGNTWYFGIEYAPDIDADYEDVLTAAGGYGTYTLQATTQSTNRLQEVYLSAESILNQQIACNGDGSMRVGLPSNLGGVDQDDPTTGSPETWSGVVPILKDKNREIAIDDDWFPNRVIGYYAEPLVISNTSDFIINSAAITRVGGTEQTANSNESKGLFGSKSFKRSDLICESDTLAGNYASGLMTYDGYSSTWTPHVDQTLQPTQVVVVDQHSVQRALDLHTAVLVDIWRDETTYPQVRFRGRIASVSHIFTRVGSGISWRTTLSILATNVYKYGAL